MTPVFSCLPKSGLGVKTAPENWGTKYLFNCFTYNSGILHRETDEKNFRTMRDEKCDFLKFGKKI